MRRSGVRLLSSAPAGKRLSAIVVTNISACQNPKSSPCRQRYIIPYLSEWPKTHAQSTRGPPACRLASWTLKPDLPFRQHALAARGACSAHSCYGQSGRAGLQRDSSGRAPTKKPAEAGLCLRNTGQACLRRATQAIAPKLNDSNTTVPGSGTEAVKSPSRTAIANLGERMSYT